MLIETEGHRAPGLRLFESICGSCTFFVTTIEFRPTLHAQRDDAHRKGQLGRQKVFDGLLQRLDQTGA